MMMMMAGRGRGQPYAPVRAPAPSWAPPVAPLAAPGWGADPSGWSAAPPPTAYYAPPPPAAAPPAPSPPLDAVAAWLTGAGFAHYIPVFAENGFDTMELLRDITDGELELLFNGRAPPACCGPWSPLPYTDPRAGGSGCRAHTAVQAPLGHRMRFKRAFSQLHHDMYAYAY
jgi:hypothetical protein